MKKETLQEIQELIKHNECKVIKINYNPNGCNTLHYKNKDDYKFMISTKSLHRCGKQQMVNKQNIYSIFNIHNYIKLNNITCRLTSEEYTGVNGKLKFICKCKDYFFTTFNHFLHDNKHQCNNCSNKSRSERMSIKDEDLIKRAKKYNCKVLSIYSKHLRLYIEFEDEYGYKYKQRAISFQHQPTPHLVNNHNPYSIDNINLHISYRFNIYSKVISEKYDKNTTKLILMCNCGNRYERSWEHITKVKSDNLLCHKCSNSIGEEKIIKYLLNNNIEFITQHRFKDCRNKLPLPFDVYLINKNTCIEFQGIQHYKAIGFFGGQKRYEQTLISDEIKQKYCKDNNIKLILISYLDMNNVETILSKAI